MHDKKENILIADAGGTKTNWCLLGSDETIERFSSPGANAMLATPEELETFFAPVAERYDTCRIDRIFYYGAGCSTPMSRTNLTNAIKRFWPYAQTEVEGDMLGAARAMLGKKPGIACILGTGGNTCLYNGTDITEKLPSLGYAIGDPGSGAALGQRLLKNMFLRQFSQELTTEFFQHTGCDLEQALEHIYRKPFPNRYIASFAPFLKKNCDRPEIRELLMSEFDDFFRLLVCKYPADNKVAICGSIAYHFEPQIREAGRRRGIEDIIIVPDPIDGMIRYHSENQRNKNS